MLLPSIQDAVLPSANRHCPVVQSPAPDQYRDRLHDDGPRSDRHIGQAVGVSGDQGPRQGRRPALIGIVAKQDYRADAGLFQTGVAGKVGDDDPLTSTKVSEASKVPLRMLPLLVKITVVKPVTVAPPRSRTPPLTVSVV